MNDGDWQPAALYGGLALLVCILFYRWNKSSHFKNFCLLHAVANREGYYDPDRAHLTGTFLISSFFVVICVIRNAVDPQLVLLFGAYTSVFALKSAWNYTVARRGDTDVKTAEIRRGRHEDDEDGYLGADRRERTTDLDDERPPGMAKRSVMR